MDSNMLRFLMSFRSLRLEIYKHSNETGIFDTIHGIYHSYRMNFDAHIRTSDNH